MIDLADITVGDFLLNSVRESGFSLIGAKGVDLAEAVHTFISIGLVVAIIIKGLMIMHGDLVGTSKSLLKMCLWAVIGIAITEPSLYTSLLIMPSIDIRDNLSIFMISNDDYEASNIGIFGAISDSFNYMFNYAFALFNEGGMTNITPIIAGLVVSLVYGLYYLSIVVNMVLCEIILNFLYLFGLLVIPLSAFETLRGTLKSWATLIAQYSLVVICSSMFISILNNINRQAIENLSQIKGVDGILSPWMGLVLLVAAFGVLIMKVAFDVAAHLSGGMLGAGKDGGASVSSGLKSVGSAIGGIGKGAKGVNSLAKAAKAKASGGAL